MLKSHDCIAETALRWVSTTPLGCPDEPEVYMTQKSSSGSIFTSGKAVLSRATIMSQNDCTLAISEVRTNTRRIPNVSANRSKLADRGSSTKANLASHLANAYSSSWLVHQLFKNTGTAPAQAIAINSIGYSGQLRIKSPTRSPGLTPKSVTSAFESFCTAA